MERVLIFIVVLGPLVFFHELGHFLIARLTGVGVERFSLGFGPKLFGKTIGRTDYRVSLLPLGGYVKMVGDEPDKPLDPEDEPLSFNNKPVYKRAMIVVAGPFFNLLLALLIYLFIFYFWGIQTIRPVVRDVAENSPAQQAGIRPGDVIADIQGKPVKDWTDIDADLADSSGRPLAIRLKRDNRFLTVQVQPKVVNITNAYGENQKQYDIGIEPYIARKAIVDNVVEGKPAALAKLKPGDQIVAINGQPVDRWETMQKIVADSKGETLKFEIRRGDKTFSVDITPEESQERDELGVKHTVYRIGIMSTGSTLLEKDKMRISLGPLESLQKAVDQTWLITESTGVFLVKLVQRKVPTEAIGGPIRIAQIAEREAQLGFLRLLNFIAVISVSLAVLNVLPIPVLDGGHLLFFAIEAVQRKPVSLRTRETAQQIGVFLLILLMIFVFYNDITVTFF
ncbi:MAG: RIP metalloprotease RseP [Desulfosarcinaceae bacterium]